VALHFIDDMDSKMAAIRSTFDCHPAADLWTGRNPSLRRALLHTPSFLASASLVASPASSAAEPGSRAPALHRDAAPARVPETTKPPLPEHGRPVRPEANEPTPRPQAPAADSATSFYAGADEAARQAAERTANPTRVAPDEPARKPPPQPETSAPPSGGQTSYAGPLFRSRPLPPDGPSDNSGNDEALKNDSSEVKK
jgi:hypothetical protein